ncbi:MAG: cation:dicarboxylase symporter family transporter [Spirochaetales bacterium]|nr:cation:dicarboxylase symporter family transporter [Spirochaetales bacterium]MCF7938621.1 cation:dicarboxylase symporter family transporter [Spirochaetales bacterium]
MKVWIKFIIGAAAGILLSTVIEGETARRVVTYLQELIINIGRYALFPLIFFSLASAVSELRHDGRFVWTYMRIGFYLILTAGVLSILGTLTVLLFSPERVPIIIESQKALALPGIQETLLGLFPRNLFQTFIPGANNLLPIVLLAVLIGAHFTYDSLSTRPSIDLFDSLSRVFYRLNAFFVEIIGVAVLVLGLYFVMNLKSIEEIGLFRQLIIVLIVDTAIVLFVLYPVLYWLFARKKGHPFKWIFGLLGPAIAGFLSGDMYFSTGILVRHGNENLGVPRSIGSPVYSSFAFFGRAGTAMITTIAFVVIFRSYSSLDIRFMELLWIMVMGFALSFALGTMPGMGAIVAVSFLCSAYGRGLEDGYLIMQPIAPLLMSFGTLIDVMTAGFISQLIAKNEGIAREVDIGDYA